MTYTTAKVKADPLTYSDRVLIANVLTWDAMKTIRPEEIETFLVKDGIVWVRMTEGRAYPIHREQFLSIKKAQEEAAELQMSEAIHQAATAEFHAWLFQPIGTNPDAIFGYSDEEIATFPVAPNGYHDPNWSLEGCEF